jgi:uncharacterized membrane protein YqjE
MAEPELVHHDSIGGLIRGIFSDLRALIREEIALARVELREQAGRARTAAISFGMAAGALLFGATFMLIALAMGVADLMNWPAWAGFLAVALLMSVTGTIALSAGRSQLRRVHAVPEETVASLKENSAWIAKRLQSARR